MGLDGSLASLRALRQALWEARQRSAILRIIHVRPSSGGGLHGPGLYTGTQVPAAHLDREAEVRMARWIDDAMGELPTDLAVEPVILTGQPGPALIGSTARDNDLLVVGTDSRGRWRRRSVSRYCTANARCPVLVIPMDGFARSRKHDWLREVLGRRDLWAQFEATTDASREDRR